MTANEINILQTAIWTVLFIIPGYVASRVKHYWMLTTQRQPTEKTIESLIWSFILYFILYFAPKSLFNLSVFFKIVENYIKDPGKLLFSFAFLRRYVLILGIAWLTGFIWGRFYPSRFMSRLLHRTPYTRVWDEFFYYNSKKASDNGVWIQMKDGSEWAGKLVTVTDTPGSSELWLTDIRKYDKETLLESTFSDMLVSNDNISRIFVLNDGVCPPVEKKKRSFLKWFKGKEKAIDTNINGVVKNE